MFQRVVVPLDGSDIAEQVLPYAVLLTTPGQGTLHLLRVEKPFPYDFPELPGDMAEVFTRQADVSSRDYLDGVSRRLEGKGLSIQADVRHGRPVDEIRMYVEEIGADLIALETHGRTGLARWAFGSVANELAHSAGAHLLTVRTGSVIETTLRQVIVPMDGTPTAEDALAPALEIARTHNAALHLIRVMPEPTLSYAEPDNPAFSAAYAERTAQINKYAEEYLAKIRTKLASSGVMLETAVVQGTAEESILVYAHGRPGSLLCMTTHSREGIRHFFLGSVAEGVRQNADCPVLLIRPS